MLIFQEGATRAKIGRSSLIYNPSTRQERHECNTSDTNATRVRHERSAT